MKNSSIEASLEFAEKWYAKELSDPANLCDWRLANTTTYTTSCGHFQLKSCIKGTNPTMRPNLAGDYKCPWCGKFIVFHDEVTTLKEY